MWSVRSTIKAVKDEPPREPSEAEPEAAAGKEQEPNRRRIAPRLRQRGSVAVEFALLAPILVALVCGIVTAGLGYNNVLGLADGVREGARYGSTLPAAGSWGATVQQKAVDFSQLNSGGHTVLTSSMVCAQLVMAPSTIKYASTCGLTAPAPSLPSGVTAGTCVVKVWAQIPVTLKFVLIPSQTINVVRRSVSLYERGTC